MWITRARALALRREPRRAADEAAGVGTRTAQRLAFRLLRVPKEEAPALAAALQDVKERVRFCSECGNLTEDGSCEIDGVYVTFSTATDN